MGSVAQGIQDIAGLRPGPGSNPIDIGDGRVPLVVIFATVAVGGARSPLANHGNNRVRSLTPDRE